MRTLEQRSSRHHTVPRTATHASERKTTRSKAGQRKEQLLLHDPHQYAS